MAPNKRTVFFISDRTGITAETLGRSLLTQFNVELEEVSLPFIDRPDRAEAAVRQINEAALNGGLPPIVFSTVVDSSVRDILLTAEAKFFDFFDTFIGPLEDDLGMRSSHMVGRSHGVGDNTTYSHRIEAMNYALSHDDGMLSRNYDRADIILVGVSRTGKTPVCIYMALQFGIYAANYPLTSEDVLSGKLPAALLAHRTRLYGLTIRPERLVQIRGERRPNSAYASLRQCQYEVARTEALFRHEKIPHTNTTIMSIEEISTTILQETKLKRRLF